MDHETAAACGLKRPLREPPLDYETKLPGDLPGNFASILEKIPKVFSELLFYLNQNGIIIDCFTGDSVVIYAASESFLGKHFVEILPSTASLSFLSAFTSTMQTGQVSSFEYNLDFGTEFRRHSANCVKANDSNLVVIIRDITEQKRISDIAHRQNHYMYALQEIAHQLSRDPDSQSLGKHITQTCVKQIGVLGTWLGWVKADRSLQELAFAHAKDQPHDLHEQIKPSADELKILLKTKSYLIGVNLKPRPDMKSTRAYFPLISHDQVIGVMGLIADSQDFFTAECINFFYTYNLLAASTIHNARLYEDSSHQLSQIQTLRAIDQVILGNMDLKSMTTAILQEVAKHIHVDALALLVLDPKTKTLDFVSGHGFRFETLRHSHLKIGESYAGQVALEKKIIHIENLQIDPLNFSRATNFRDEGFMMYLGIPLIARSDVKGVLEIFQRKPFEPDEAWLTLLKTLANQIAIAIDNSLLLKSLQDSNNELSSTYDATIEILSRALELRDQETDGHTRRVTEMTMALAKKMGVQENELVYIRQGALLHDIGKMGIPDSILLKPESLTAEEWIIMRQHPLYAYELLSRVEYLKPAIDIPLYHHEKWNGSGYPYGLKGEQIPFAARLFAFVDVFDALISDRPYRPAWKKEDTLAYIRTQSGIHFDPAILPVFEELIRQTLLHDSSITVNYL